MKKLENFTECKYIVYYEVSTYKCLTEQEYIQHKQEKIGTLGGFFTFVLLFGAGVGISYSIGLTIRFFIRLIEGFKKNTKK